MLSIIIPVYNREGLVAETLESVRSQIRGDWECLVVDDHSTDGTEAVIQSFAESDSRFKFFRRPDSLPKGPSSCRNFGFSQSSGDFIYFLDSDDLIGKDFVSSFVPYFERDPELEFLNFRFVRFGKDLMHIIRVSPPKPSGVSLYEAFASFSITVGTQTYIWRRSLLVKESHLWREDLSFGEDQELYFRLILRAKKGFSVNEPVQVFYRRNRSGLCCKRRYDRQLLSDSFEIYKSRVQSCLACGAGQKVQQCITKYLRKQMRLALRFGDRNALRAFYELTKQIDADPKERSRIESMYRHPFLWTCRYRPFFLLSKMFSGVVSGL